MSEPSVLPPAPSRRHLVVTVHGIRTFGHWQERLEKLLKEKESGVDVWNYKYGYFSILAFIVPFLRWLVVWKFRSELREALKQPRWTRVDLVGHSFGTHLIGHALRGLHREGLEFEVHTVLLAGSVLKVNFPWRSLMDDGRVHRLVNDCGTRDDILVLSQAAVLGTGMAGRAGFNGLTHARFRNRYFAFGHGGFFGSNGVPDDNFMTEWWLPLLSGKNDPVTRDERQITTRGGFWTFVLNNAEPIKVAAYASIPVAFCIWFYSLFRGEQAASTEARIQTGLTRTALKTAATALKSATEQKLLSDRRGFNGQLALAEATWREDREAAIRLLDDPLLCPPELRDFTWSYLTRMARRRQNEFGPSLGPSSRVSPIQVAVASGSEIRITWAGEDGRLLSWKRGDGEPRLISQIGSLKYLAYSHDGHQLIFWTDGHAPQKINPITGEKTEIITDELFENLSAMAISPSRPELFWADKTSLHRVDYHQGRRTGQIPFETADIDESRVDNLLVSADGATVIANRSLDSRETGSEFLVFRPDENEKPLRFEGRCRAISPDGHKFAVDYHKGPPGSFYVHAADTFFLAERKNGLLSPVAVLRSDNHEPAVMEAMFSPDGRVLAVSTTGPDWPGNLRIWDADSGQLLARVAAGSVAKVADLHLVCFLNEGAAVMTLSTPFEIKAPDSINRLVVWDAITGGKRLCSKPSWFAGSESNEKDSLSRREVPINTALGEVGVRAWSPDGKTLATSHGQPIGGLGMSVVRQGVVRLSDPVTGQLRMTLRGPKGIIDELCFSPDGSQLVAVSGSKIYSSYGEEIFLWETQASTSAVIGDPAPSAPITRPTAGQSIQRAGP